MMTRRSIAMAAITLGAVLTAGQAAAAEAPCDRACLSSTLDRYMAAVFRHDPAADPQAAKARTTINAAEVKPGEGIWRTATGYGAVRRRFIDPVNGAAMYFGHLKEGDVTDVVTVRLKVVGRRVTEAEWTVARKTDGNMFNAEGLAENPPPEELVLPPAQRATRAQMIAAADAYFDGLETHDGAKVPHVPGCDRIENGFKVTNRVRTPAPAPAAAPGAAPAPAAAPTAAQESRSGDCASGFEGFARTIAKVSPRRYDVVDEEQGVVVGAVILKRPPGVTMKRNLLTEVFYTRGGGGKISAIFAAMYYLDPSAPDTPGW